MKLNPQLFVARDELLVAAMQYAAAEKQDSTGAYYDAELELREDMLNQAVDRYVLVRKEGLKHNY